MSLVDVMNNNNQVFKSCMPTDDSDPTKLHASNLRHPTEHHNNEYSVCIHMYIHTDNVIYLIINLKAI